MLYTLKYGAAENYTPAMTDDALAAGDGEAAFMSTIVPRVCLHFREGSYWSQARCQTLT